MREGICYKPNRHTCRNKTENVCTHAHKHYTGKLISVDLTLLQLSGNMKQKHKTSTPVCKDWQVYACTCTSIHMLIRSYHMHYLKRGNINTVITESMPPSEGGKIPPSQLLKYQVTVIRWYSSLCDSMSLYQYGFNSVDAAQRFFQSKCGECPQSKGNA